MKEDTDPDIKVPEFLQQLALSVAEKLMVDDETLKEMVTEKIDANMDVILEEVIGKIALAIEPLVIREIIGKYLR